MYIFSEYVLHKHSMLYFNFSDSTFNHHDTIILLFIVCILYYAFMHIIIGVVLKGTVF